MRGSLGLGLVIGLAVGAGGMFLVLHAPWGGQGTAPGDAAVVASAPSDGGAGKGKKRRPRGHRGGGGGGGVVPGGNDDQAWANQGDEEVDTGPPPVVLTAADRAMEWRGDDVSPPPRKIDMTSESRPLEDSEINSVISSQSGAVQHCVTQSVPNAQLSATITIKMVVDGKGNVSRSKMQAPHILFEHGLLGCAQSALHGMHFPATGMPTLVTMPVNLT